MYIKNFTKDLKKLKKADMAVAILDVQPQLIPEYVKRIHQTKYQESLSGLYEALFSLKAVKGFKTYLKEYKEDIDPGWAIVIADALDKRSTKEKSEESEEEVQEILEGYTNILTKLLKPITKEISKKLDVPDAVLQEILVIAPSSDYISGEKYTGVYSRKMTAKMYSLTKKQSPEEIGLSSAKAVKKLFQAIFGKELLRWVALEILLERKDGISGKSPAGEKQMWNILTEFALQTVENLDKEDRVRTLENYCKRRVNDNKREKDSARRLALTSISKEDYPKTHKAVTKLAKNEQVAKWL